MPQSLTAKTLTGIQLAVTGTKEQKYHQTSSTNKKQVLVNLTVDDDDATTTENKTFADLKYTSLVITAYKNGIPGADAVDPMDETPLYTRTLTVSQLRTTAINLEVSHEETSGGSSEFVAGTEYVFDARFFKEDSGTTSLELSRTLHTFADAPDVDNDFTFVVTKGSNSLGLTVNTHQNKPLIKELFVEIMELNADLMPKRNADGTYVKYSLEKYTTASGGAAFTTETDQTIRASSDQTLPNSDGKLLTQAQTYNMNVIVRTDGGTSEKKRLTDGSSFNLLLSNIPNTPKVTIIDMQKQTTTDGTAPNQVLGHYLPSVLVIYEINELSAGEVLDRVKLGLTIGGNALAIASDAAYTTTITDSNGEAKDGGSYFEDDFVTEQTIGTDTRKFIVFRVTKGTASPINLVGTALATASSAHTATFPDQTSLTDANDVGKRTVAQVFKEDITVYSDNSGLGTTIANGGTTISNVKVIQVQVADLDFGATVELDTSVDTFRISNTSVDGSTDGNTNLSSNLTNFILQTNTNGSLVETASQTSFTMIKMDVTPATTNANETQLSSNTFKVEQDELTSAGNQSFSIQSTRDLLTRFVDNNLVQFIVLNMDNSGKKLFTLDSNTTPSVTDFLTGAQPLTLTHGSTIIGATEKSDSQTTYGYVPATVNGQMGSTYLAYSTPVSIVFNGTEKISNIYMAFYMAAYDWGNNYYIGPQTIRSEIGSLVSGGAITAVADGDKYNGSPSGTGNGASIAKKASDALSTGSSNTPLQAIFSGTQVSCNSFVSMERVGLIPAVEIIQAEKALLTTGLPEIIIKVTENIVLDDNYVFDSASYDLAPYDLTNANMRPSQMNITLTKVGGASQTFTFTDSTTTTFASLTQTPASGVTAGVYQVTLQNGSTVNGQAVSLVPGDEFDIYVALGNAVYGITAATVVGGGYTRLQTGTPDDMNGIQSTTKSASTLTLKTTSHASSGVAQAEVAQGTQSSIILFDREVAAPTVTITDQTAALAGQEQITVVVTANTADIDDTINYTQLLLEVTTNDGSTNTTKTFTYGTAGTQLATDAGNKLTVNGTQYTVQIAHGDSVVGGSGTISFIAGYTVTVKATLKTDYSDGAQSGPTAATTIQARAFLKSTGSSDNYLLANSSDASSALNALFDVDLIDTKTTLQFSPAHVNSGATSPTTWGDLIGTNGISTSDLALTVTPQYETTADTYEDGVAIAITIQSAGTFANLTTANTLNLVNDNAKLVAMRARGPNGETTRMKLVFTLTSTFADDTTNTSTLTTTAFQPYLHKLAAESITAGAVTYSSGTQDSLSWTVNYIPEAWKSDLSQLKANYRLIKNNISGQYLDLNTASSLLQAVDETKTGGSLGTSSTTFTKTFTTFARGSGLFPVFTLTSTASKGTYGGANNTHGTQTTTTDGAAQATHTRSLGVINSFIKATDNTNYLSFVPNGNEVSTTFLIDNDGESALISSFLKGTTTGADKMINNNSQNAIFATTQTITLALANGSQADVALLFDGIHTLNLTLGITTLTQAVTALNALECFPSVINLPGATSGTPAAVWVLGTNVIFKDSSDNVISTATSSLGATDKIELIYEGTKSTTSRVSFATVANAANNNCTFTNVTNDTFIPLTSDSTDTTNYSFTNGTNAIPLPTLVISQKGTGDPTHAISVVTSKAGDINSLSTKNVTLG